MNKNQIEKSNKEKVVNIISFTVIALLYSAASFTACALHLVTTMDYIGFFTVILPLTIDLLLCFKTKVKSYILMLAPIIPLTLGLVFLIIYNGNDEIYSMVLFDLYFLGVRIFCQILFLVKSKKLKLIPLCLIMTMLLAITTFFAYDNKLEIKELLKDESEAAATVTADKRLKFYILDKFSDIDKFMSRFNITEMS